MLRHRDSYHSSDINTVFLHSEFFYTRSKIQAIQIFLLFKDPISIRRRLSSTHRYSKNNRKKPQNLHSQKLFEVFCLVLYSKFDNIIMSCQGNNHYHSHKQLLFFTTLIFSVEFKVDE